MVVAECDAWDATAAIESSADPSHASDVDETAVLRTPVSLTTRNKPAGSEQVYVMQPRIGGEKDKGRYVVSISKKQSSSYVAIGNRIVQMVNNDELTTVGQCKKKVKVLLDEGHTIS